VGFQLSSLATAGLIWFGAAMEARLHRWPGWLREPVALTLAAQITTLPVIVSTFGRLSLVAPLANVAVVPMVPMAMLACTVAAVVGAMQTLVQVPVLGDLLAWLSGGIGWLSLRAMIAAGQLAAALPFASLNVTAPGWLALAWYPGLALASRRLKRKRAEHEQAAWTPTAATPLGPAWSVRLGHVAGSTAVLTRPSVVAGGVGALLLAISLAGLPDGRLHLTVLDIGQGDAILVQAPSGAVALIDGGPDPDLLLQRIGRALPWWQRRIDVVILTHPHEDHVAGLPAVLERYQVRLVLDPARAYPNPSYVRFLEAAQAEPGARLVRAQAGQVIRLDAAASLTILFPTPADRAAPLPAGDINNASIVTLLHSGGFMALLTGDAEAPVEALLAARGLLSPVDVLKVGHHGSHSSTTPELLDAVQPRAALISVGAGNDYGHPHRVTLDKLAAIPGLEVHRTDLEGNLEVISDGTRYVIRARTADGRWRPVRARTPAAAGRGTTNPGGPGSIAAWLFPPAPRPKRCSPPTSCRTASWCMPAASAGWRPRRRGCWQARGWRSIRCSSRSPPCSTISTSSPRVKAANRTGSSGRAG
jgi:competence protein ComEC